MEFAEEVEHGSGVFAVEHLRNKLEAVEDGLGIHGDVAEDDDGVDKGGFAEVEVTAAELHVTGISFGEQVTGSEIKDLPRF